MEIKVVLAMMTNFVMNMSEYYLDLGVYCWFIWNIRFNF